MPNISLTAAPDYASQLAEIQRRQKLAEMLQQQGAQPFDVQSSGGIPAPISFTSILAKALQAGGGAYLSGKAAQGQKELSETDKQSADDLLKALMATKQTVGGQDVAPSQADIMAPSLPGRPAAPGVSAPPVQLPGMTGAPAGQAPAMDDNAKLAAILAADGGPQTEAIRNAMLPQIMNRQNAQFDNQMTRDNKVWENSLPMSTASRQQLAAQGQQAQQNAQFENTLPMTAAQKAQTNLGYAQLNKPQFVPYGTPGYMQGGKYTPLAGTEAGGSPFGLGDPKSPSLNGQLGISSNGLNLLIGNTSAVARGRPMDVASKEADQVIARRGLDPSVVKPRVQAYGDAVKMNTLKSNTMDTLSNELKGTINNIAPIADKIGGGNIRWGKEGAQIVGSLANDQNAQQYVFYLNQLRSELAGFNAVSGGKIGLHGQVETNESHIAEAEKVIQNGLSSGGARGLAQAVEASRIKNVGIVERQTEEATRGIWNALGLGAQYDAMHPAARPAAPAKPTVSNW